MYKGLEHTHNLFRWILLIIAIITIYKYYIGWKGNKKFTSGDNILGSSFIAVMHLQLLIGLVLYFFLSPISQAAMSNMALTMKDPVLRFWGVEHFAGMLIAVIVAQVGRIISKKSANDIDKYKKGFIYYLISILIVIASIPWPFRIDGIARGWFPGM